MTWMAVCRVLAASLSLAIRVGTVTLSALTLPEFRCSLLEWTLSPSHVTAFLRTSFFAQSILNLPWIQEIDACRGEVGLVTGDDSEPMPNGCGGDQAVDGGCRFFQAGQQPPSFVRNASIDGQNTVFEPCGQLCFKPRGYPRAATTAPELLDSLPDFA